tara:strand:+ start:4431 stop:4556 length:126 start_codon:yes stop_codon:yes gene_type:complete
MSRPILFSFLFVLNTVTAFAGEVPIEADKERPEKPNVLQHV